MTEDGGKAPAVLGFVLLFWTVSLAAAVWATAASSVEGLDLFLVAGAWFCAGLWTSSLVEMRQRYGRFK